MELREGLETRRSIRKFTDKSVDREQIESIIKGASWAPSWANSQCVRFAAVDDPALKSRIANEACDGGNTNNVNGCAVVFALCAIPKKAGHLNGVPNKVNPKDWTMFDCGGAALALCLAAHAEGLGTVQIGHFKPEKVEEILGVDKKGWQVVELIACGHPAEAPAPRARLGLDELMIFNSAE